MKAKIVVPLIAGIVAVAGGAWFTSPGYWNGCTVHIQRRHANEVTDSVVTTITNPSKGAALAFGNKNIRWYGMEAPKEGAFSLTGQ